MARTVAIIQARTGSTRLPGKVLKTLCGKTVLAHVIERVKQASEVDEVVIATTTAKGDDAIVDEALRCGAKVFRGSEEDVLSRYYFAATENAADIVVRITSDCPVIDPHVIDRIIQYFRSNSCDIVSNAGSEASSRTFPRGLDTEVLTYRVLEDAYRNAEKKYQREHVTPYIYEHGSVQYYLNDIDCSHYRWTLDTEQDWQLIRKLYGYLYHGKHDFYLNDILRVMEDHPELYDINKDIEQKKLEKE